jgi:hypothetical protein
MAPPPETGEQTHDLASVFGFTTEQLAANREGQLADGQTSSLWVGVLWGVPLSLAALGLGLAAIKFARGFLRVLGPILGTGAAVLLAAVVAYPSLRDMLEPTVAVAEGPVTEQVGAGKGHGTAVLTIDGKRLMTMGPTLVVKEASVRDEVYRAYYLPNTKRMLSIERVGGAPP